MFKKISASSSVIPPKTKYPILCLDISSTKSGAVLACVDKPYGSGHVVPHIDQLKDKLFYTTLSGGIS